jgi:hypothetical protein
MDTTPGTVLNNTTESPATVMSNPSVKPTQDPLTAQELVRAIVAARQNVEHTPQTDEIFSHLESVGSRLRAEVGGETYFVFADTIARFRNEMDKDYPIDKHLGLSIPHRLYDINTIFSFTSQELFAAAREYDEEKYAARCRSSKPNYEPHPAFDRFNKMAEELTSKCNINLYYERATKENALTVPPWLNDADAQSYNGFPDTLLDRQSPGWGLELAESSERRGSISSDRTDLPDFTARELLDAGIALDAEMRANNCETGTPDYSPHPAYDRFMEMKPQMEDSESLCLFMIQEQLGRAGVSQWLSLEATYRVMEHQTLDNRPGMTLIDAADIVDHFKRPEVESISLENIQCPICFIDFNEPAPDEINNTPVRAPCCNQIFGRGCYIKALEGDKRCPMCRTGFEIEITTAPVDELTALTVRDASSSRADGTQL